MSVFFTNLIAAIVLILIVGGASLYIYREKKKGVHCIGCPSGDTCSGNCSDPTRFDNLTDEERRAYNLGKTIVDSKK